MKINGSRKQRGVIVVLVAVVLPVLLFAAGWALDFGHTFVNKTRLQNALDATALSAAIAINSDPAKSIGAASTKGRETFNLFKDASGNNELKGLDAGALVFDCSPTLQPWASPCSSTDPFAFVRVKSIDMLNVTPVLVRIFRPEDIKVPAVATAGPVGQNCSLVPFVMCATMTPLDENCEDDTIIVVKEDPLDPNSKDIAVPGQDGINDCYGYNIGQIRSLVQVPDCTGDAKKDPAECAASLESGNFNLLELDGSQGGKDIRDTLQGTTNICLQGNTLTTKPGWTWGNVKQGIDDRFESDTQKVPYPLPNNYSPSPYTQYATGGLGNNRRVLGAPIGDCRGVQNGKKDLPKVGITCVFLTEKAIQDPGGIKAVNVEFTGQSCEQNGVWDPNNPVLKGPYKIVLFKSPGSGDS